jgi:hypothetical protein
VLALAQFKDGSHATVSLTAESLSDKPFAICRSHNFLLSIGRKWQSLEPGELRFRGFAWSGVEIDLVVKMKGTFSFVAKDAETGTEYSLICPEASPQQGRRITIHRIGSH